MTKDAWIEDAMELNSVVCAAYKMGCEQTREVYQKRIEELETALTPFLKLPIGVINDDPPELEVYQCHGWPRDQRAVVTVADFRRVRKALEGKDDEALNTSS